MITFDSIKNNELINTYISQADKSLTALGYTEHSFTHANKVANDAAYILKSLNYSSREIELAKIAGYMHDIGNLVNRVDHSQSGAIMAYKILSDLNADILDICDIVSAIGNHDEGSGVAVNAIAAALIIADKSDVRRSRVRDAHETNKDIHDRVNYSVLSSKLTVRENNIILSLQIDSEISPVLEYFEIFLNRMKMCKNAANKLNAGFKLYINDQQLM